MSKITFGEIETFGEADIFCHGLLQTELVDVLEDDKYIGFISSTNKCRWTSNSKLWRHANETQFANESLDGIKQDIINFFGE